VAAGVWLGEPGGNSARAQSPPIDVLHIDPLLIEQAIEVWSVVASDHNEIWPGWNATETPLLFYLPGKQDVLIGHPNPPEGFRPYHGPLEFPGKTIFVRDGQTLLEFDGQNTSMDIEGCQTLVVADTLSNRLPQIQALLDNPPAEGSASVDYSVLQSDVISTLGLIAHEAFHVYQHQQASNKAANELDLAQYPTLSVDNNVGFALEGEALAAALTAPDESSFRRAAVEWLAVRKWRRGSLSPESIAYEDGMEFNEGLAKYVEYRLTEVLKGRQPRPSMWLIQGFSGFADLEPARLALVQQMRQHMRGEANVNNDPFGGSPLRMRFYFSGMAVAALLDRLAPGWKEQMFQPGTTLAGLAETALAASDEELRAAIEQCRQGSSYESLLAEKRSLQERGLEFVSSVVETIERGPNTTLVIDYSDVEDADIGMAFTPFGILPVDESRTIFRLIPLTVRLRANSVVRQTRPSDLLHDRAKKQLAFQLSERISREELMAQLGRTDAASGDGPVPLELEALTLPGAELKIGPADVTWDEARIVIRLRAG
jgi:hypothetical protein